VALAGADLGEAVAGVMTSGLVTLGAQATAHEAVLAMARHGVRRVVVLDDEGRLAGVVSREDLLALPWADVDEIGAQIQAGADLEALRRAAERVRRLARALLAQGVGAEALTQAITTLHDLLTIRVIDLTAERFELPPVATCWIALGSEGRFEQTFVTDQDNGIVFEAEQRDAPAVRDALLPFARAVNDALDACGFATCKGGVMAGNPRWCLSLQEWRSTFARWLDRPDPQALLHATIFFDLRPIHGAEVLAERLRDWLLSVAWDRPLFLRLMAENALGCAPPLGTFRDFVVDRSPEHRGTIDLKKDGSRPFVDAARVLALAHRVAHTSTAQRLRALVDAVPIPQEEVTSVVDGFHFVHLLRLRSQCDPRTGRERTNRVDPRQLGELERHVLKEAFRQARRLQRRLAAEHGLS
jgi:CBS domain-containing protein